jgi:hypothetical protein
MLKQLVILVSFVSFFGVISCAQEKPETEKKEMHKHATDLKSDSTNQQSIVREGEIDLNAIDENKDGKVFQDPMDWNVISDKAGRCPLCKMELKEVTLNEAKENLLKNDFKVKEN